VGSKWVPESLSLVSRDVKLTTHLHVSSEVKNV